MAAWRRSAETGIASPTVSAFPPGGKAFCVPCEAWGAFLFVFPQSADGAADRKQYISSIGSIWKRRSARVSRPPGRLFRYFFLKEKVTKKNFTVASKALQDPHFPHGNGTFN